MEISTPQHRTNAELFLESFREIERYLTRHLGMTVQKGIEHVGFTRLLEHIPNKDVVDDLESQRHSQEPDIWSSRMARGTRRGALRPCLLLPQWA